MEGIKHSRQFAETESLMDNYFVCHIVPVMKQTQAYLNEKQGEEMKEYSTSIGGILSMMATAGQPLGDPYQPLKVTGEWNSKTTEDYIAMCREKIVSSDEMQHDLACIAGQWRHAVVQEIGRERYDELSKELGCDLAYAYVDYRVEQLMIDRLVKERMPKSSAEYIIRKAAESSLLGLPQVLGRSPLAEEIEARGEAAYRPGKVEKGAAWALGASVDTVMLGGAGSWTTFAKFIGADAAVSTVIGYLEKDKPEGPTVEACISKGVFGIDGNVFTTFRKEAAAISPQENVTLSAANNMLRKKIPVCEFDFTEWMQVGNTQWWPDFGASVHDREETGRLQCRRNRGKKTGRSHRPKVTAEKKLRLSDRRIHLHQPTKATRTAGTDCCGRWDWTGWVKSPATSVTSWPCFRTSCWAPSRERPNPCA